MKKIALSLTMLVGMLTANNAAAFEGDINAGKDKSAVCAACHGADGNSVVSMYPKLAGQHAEYIYKQLVDLKQGMVSGGKEGRMDPVMSGMAMPLSDQDMKDLAVYFSSLNMKAGETPEDVVEAGKKLYKAGDAERGIPACTACHGPRGNGNGLAKFPKVSFQHADYIKGQLVKFRDGTRRNDPNGMMSDIAKKLTDKDIEILSKYLGGLH